MKENSTVDDQQKLMDTSHWRRILLLIIAITVHNIPEGLAVGVGFGAVGQLILMIKLQDLCLCFCTEGSR